MATFSLREFDAQAGRIILINPSFDFDSYPPIGERLVSVLSATIIEKQSDADLHSWLLDFEGCQLFLRAEHYSETMWIEALSPQAGCEELQYLTKLFAIGIG
ncbi:MULTISPECIES: DUF3630 family protein [Vibrio]|uniref:DUF3630 family protein n=1 Tax=Vibrio algicola TaxID=2662262 RepID=A0A5Q0TFG0_9VIBR|nr:MULTISPECIES: DUF3630 family protein [Vibrio]MBD1576038.1 DUF3630 family protein [Vibrio sp. S11_S32]